MNITTYLMVSIDSSTSVLVIILLILGIISSIYFLITLRRVSIAAKKIDYFYEDLTYKSESLNTTVDTIARISNYLEIFEAFSKRNLKSWVNVTVRNKDVFYKLFDRIKDFANEVD
ncbi:hypothetical protein [Spiroplasma endosymbiont of Aspidapion aeneum]|uniref:hypothetical protein n=1 Tax=Spiroplasma endosymbiont of Aspidapion aeneum TaxID=3066276 RepID=UPI00313D4EBB